MMLRTIGALIALLPATASAQLVLDPSGQTPLPQGPPPNPYYPGAIGVPGAPLPPQPPPPPPQIYINLPEGGTAPAEQGKAPADAPPEMYLGPVPGAGTGQRYEGETPEAHVVQKGDTLWDICGYYFGDALKWPQVWGLNPTISNPHWIYPGEVVKLQEGAGTTVAPTAPATQPSPGAEQPAGPELVTDQAPSAVELRQLAFVSAEDLKVAGLVTGSKEEKAMLSLYDQVYVEYAAGSPPQVGRRYAVYAPTRDIKHPETGKVIGAYVLVKGTIEITDVKKDKRALGIITQVHDFGFLERGERVGTLKTQFRSLEPVAADRSLEGVVAGVLGTDNIIGDWQVVFIDRGSNDGLKVGNEMLVVRRGDAYPSERGGDIYPMGMDDRRYPDNYIATILVLDTGKTTALGLVTRVDKEVLRGDHVLMRKPK